MGCCYNAMKTYYNNLAGSSVESAFQRYDYLTTQCSRYTSHSLQICNPTISFQCTGRSMRTVQHKHISAHIVYNYSVPGTEHVSFIDQ